MKTRALSLRQADWNDTGRRRLLAAEGDPFLFAVWEPVVFLHFALEPENLRPQIPAPFALELYDGVGVISLVAVTMRRFRPVRPGSIAGWPFALISRQRFLNLRTYVRLGDEAGALFLWGWLSPPLCLPFPSGMFGLPYAFATLRFEHRRETGELGGLVSTPVSPGRFAYRARVDARSPLVQCGSGTLDEFALERYTGFFRRGDERCVFRVWHPPWQHAPIAAEIEDRSLLDTSFPWFKRARLIGGSYAPGFEQLWLGKAHPLPLPRRRRGVLSTFFEMP